MCVHCVRMPACETVASARGHKTVSLQSVSSHHHPAAPDSHPPIWSHRGPLVPETPCSRPVLMSPDLANSFNHLLIPKASQADLKAPQKPFSPAIVAKSYSCCANDAPSFTAQIQALHYLQKLRISSRSFINGLTCFQGREARKTISLLITVKWEI